MYLAFSGSYSVVPRPLCHQQNRQRNLRPRRHWPPNSTCRATPVSPAEEVEVRALQPEEEVRWKAAIQELEAAGFGSEDAEGLLRRAFGWLHSSYWRTDKVQEAPPDGQVKAVLAFLGEQGLTGGDALTIIRKFPEVLAISVPDGLQANIDKLEKDWKLKGPAIAGVLKRQPRVLGYCVDCLGDCIGECDRCWVRF
eukprot:jgi/Botrbrau1/21345/Bobra.0184s0055.2